MRNVDKNKFDEIAEKLGYLPSDFDIENVSIEDVKKAKLSFDLVYWFSCKRNLRVSNLIENTINPPLKPFAKWLGGKRRLYEHISKVLPQDYQNYIEPFVGGGAVLFLIKPNTAIINDKNSVLVECYNMIQSDEYHLVKKHLKKFEKQAQENRENVFCDIRKQFNKMKLQNRSITPIQVARFLFLNKNGYNGVYRENANGEFNVPFNKNSKMINYDFDNLDNIHEYLSNSKIKIFTGDYKKIIEKAKPGDFVYLDPPYDSEYNNSFVQYTSDGFGKKQQKELADLCKQLDKKGCKFLLSNHNTKDIKEWYKGFNFYKFNVRRNINSVVEKRRDVEEVLIYNYDLD